MRFDQSSAVQPNPEIKSSGKKYFFLQKILEFGNISFAGKQRGVLLVLPIEEISLRPKLSSPVHFGIQGGSPERDIHRSSSSRTSSSTVLLLSNIGCMKGDPVILG